MSQLRGQAWPEGSGEKVFLPSGALLLPSDWQTYACAKREYSQGMYTFCIPKFFSLSQKSHPGAMFYLGKMCLTGVDGHVKQDVQRGIRIMLAAGERFYPKAYDRLLEAGDKSYDKGISADGDPAEQSRRFRHAKDLYQKVSDAGYPFGTLRLAQMVLCIDKDIEKAGLMWALAKVQYAEKWKMMEQRKPSDFPWGFNHELFQRESNSIKSLTRVPPQEKSWPESGFSKPAFA